MAINEFLQACEISRELSSFFGLYMHVDLQAVDLRSSEDFCSPGAEEIDKVQGAKGAVQIESFYPAFPELSSPKLSSHASYSSLRRSDKSKHLDSPPDDYSPSGTASKSHSSPCSRSSCSSNCSSARAQQHDATTLAVSSNGNGALLAETSNGILKRTCSSELAEFHSLNNHGDPDFLVRSQIHKTRTVSDHIHLSELECPPRFGQSLRGVVYGVKAIYGVEQVRLGLQPKWGLRDLQQEIGKRFEIYDFTDIGLKYMDDNGDWVRLTCKITFMAVKDNIRDD
ncbi:hypothetical protein POTOM_033786 [Populus tomentosa]|uniref:PB1 domain-containing protein n=1 Tax=Populus tomentosa TaxID=118781 RepID=A0A8X7Z6F6_POPTO|nr:hypothetical protein POTOM_033786 [Populus tomentosa]